MHREITVVPSAYVQTFSDDIGLRVAVSERLGGARDLARPVVVVDPRVGVPRLQALAEVHGPQTDFAVVDTGASAMATLAALRLERAMLIPDPRRDITGAERLVAGASRTPPALGMYPRVPAFGIEVVSPLGLEVLELSPYELVLAGAPDLGDIIKLQLQIARFDEPVEVTVDRGAYNPRAGRLVVRFRVVDEVVRRELLNMVKARLLADTIDRGLARPMQVQAGLRLVGAASAQGALAAAHRGCGSLTFAVLDRGRCVRGEVCRLDGDGGFWVTDTDALPDSGDVRFSLAVQHESFLMQSTVLERSDDGVRLSPPTVALASDHRAHERLALGPGRHLRIQIDGTLHELADFSAGGLSFVADDLDGLTPGSLVSARIGSGPDARAETLQIRNTRSEGSGWRVGAMFAPRDAHLGVAGEIIERAAPAERDIVRVRRRYLATRVSFEAQGRRVAALATEVVHPGPGTVIVVAPGWCKTKESSALLAQLLATSFDASGRHVLIERIDYTNWVGESWRDPANDKAGCETLGLELSACVEDLRAAVADAVARSARPAERVVLVGTGFSGPLVLRAAVVDPLVTHLVQLMGAADIQDFVRTATGGVDYVARHRAGVDPTPQNILGVLSRPDVWCADGERHGLLRLHDAQADALRLNKPLLWVHGAHDGFVSEARVRTVLASARSEEKRLAVLPLGHAPTKGGDALQSLAPIASFLLGEGALVVAPDDEILHEAANEEWAAAPRIMLPDPRTYWRGYMLGERSESLGYEVFTMTEELQGLMRVQAELLDLEPGSAVHDVGGGTGAALGSLVANGAAKAHVYDLIPEVLMHAELRARDLGIAVQTTHWDAARSPVPRQLHGARRVLMSLFLSCLRDPLRVLTSLRDTLADGAVVVASSIRPDADLSVIFTGLLKGIKSGTASPPPGMDADDFAVAVREYVCSAAGLLRLADQGAFHLYEAPALTALFERAGFQVTDVRASMGSPARAVIVKAVKGSLRS